MSNVRLTARFTPDPAPENTEELPGYLSNSLAKVGGMLNSPTRNFAPLNEAPPKPTEGDIAFADGVSWNPVGEPNEDGRGLYMYNGTEWVLVVDSGGGSGGGGIPIGGIIIWTGAAPPSQWTLCDGNAAPNGMACPDLQDKFVKGGGAVAVGTTGGSINTGTHVLTTAQMPSHNHIGPEHRHSGPSHAHTQQGSFLSDSKGNHNHGGFSYISSRFTTLVSGANWNIFEAGEPATILGSGNHTHTTTISGQTSSNGTGNTGWGGDGNTGSKGSSGGHNHTLEPVYYAVAYIMRYE